MNWTSLFSTLRIGSAAQPEPSVRSDFQRDSDRILFSAAFRRMQDKTQVFPLEKNDYVRTRLTHSLEVSCVGRSLGSSAGTTLLMRYPELQQHITAADVGDIVAAACLAHDLGNPPFGHSGEQAMRDFFVSDNGRDMLQALQLSPAECTDLTHIEGNAQGFRICNRLESPDNHGGLRLTASTLAAAAKYPCTAFAVQDQAYYKKNGVYIDDVQDYSAVFAALHLPEIAPHVWQRHPLSYLMEAADDSCYLIADIEDAYQIGQIPFSDAYDLLQRIARPFVDDVRLQKMQSKSDRLAYLRAKAIGCLVHETLEVFWQSEQALLGGNFKGALLDHIRSSTALQALRDYAVDHIYHCRSVLEMQIAGHRVLNGLIEIFCTAILHQHLKRAGKRDAMVIQLLPNRYRRHHQNNYQSLLAVCDYITGMTDSYAVSLYKKLTGISLPAE